VVWFAGLCQLPALSRLTELDCLAASFNNISSLPHLVPVDAAAVAAAVTAAVDNGSSNNSSSEADDSNTAAVTAAATTAADVAAQLDKLLVSKVPSALPGCLTRLGLPYNQLECVPLELPAALPQLSSLDLSHNRQVVLQ
jgi:Leucine-rich repeat (LRR) protein